MLKKTKLTKEEIENAIDYLAGEKFIINYEDYNKIMNDEKFNRQSLFFSITSDNIKNWKISKKPKILILGLGGVGSNVTILLSRAGFNNFILVDSDKVEESNLIRQFPYDYNDIGKYKTDVLKDKVINTNVKVINKQIEKKEDIEHEISKSDIVICTLDKPYRIIRRLINRLCVKHNKPVIFSGFSEHVAMVGPFVVPGKSACLKCIEKNIDETPLNNILNVPSYGPLCALISSLVANEIINYFYKYNKNNLIGKTLMFNILNYECNTINWKKKKDCEVCLIDSK